MPPPTPEDDPDFEQVQEERRLLNQLRLRTFTVTPDIIQPFQQATLRWEVTVPAAAAHVATLALGGAIVPATGTRSVSPLETGGFVLEARSPLTKRILGSRVVQVDQTGLQERLVPVELMQGEAQGVKDLLRAGRLSSRGDVTVTMQPPDGILFHVPLKASIPDFYDADIDLDLPFTLAAVSQSDGERVLRVRLRRVGVDVIFHVLEHIFSVGTATAARAMLEPLAADLLQGFLGPQIEQLARAALQPVVDQMLVGMAATDPQHRTHRLYAIEAQPLNLVVLGAPVPASANPPAPDRKRGRRGRRSARTGTPRAVRLARSRKDKSPPQAGA